MGEAAVMLYRFGTDAIARDLTARELPGANVRSLAASANGNGAGQAGSGRVDALAALGRRKLRIGNLTVELRIFTEQTSIDLRASSARALLIVPLRGAAEIVSNGDPRLSCEPGAPALLARTEAVTGVWHPSSLVALVYFPRAGLQVAASERLGGARRLAAANLKAGRIDSPDPLEKLVIRLANLARTRASDADAKLFEADFYRAVVDRFIKRGGEGPEIFPRSRTVDKAMQLVRADHAEAWNANRLAAVVGVTAPTLRKNFKASLGVAITDFIYAVRLDWAHERLSSARDSRSIAELSTAAGFSSATTFSRAYLRRFAEAPSQTRARAVRMK